MDDGAQAAGGRTIAYEPGIDGLRALSIIGVLLFHACATSSLTGWFRGGNLGVSVFFTLSGFLITTLLVTELDRDGRIDLRRFWTRRIRRLAPASLAVVIAVTLLSATSWFDLRRSDALAATWSVTNWHVIVGGQERLLQTIVGPLGPTWSLAVEEQFYVLLAIGVWLASRTARPVRAIAIGASVAVATSLAIANTVSDWAPRLEFGTDVRAAELAVGCLLAIAWRGHREQLTTRPSVAGVADAVGAGAVAGLIVLFLTAGTAPWLLRGGHVLVALVSAAAIIGVLVHGRLHRVLAVAPLVAVGRWSYALYLVHWPVFLVLTEGRTNLDGVALVAVKLAVAGVLGVALHLLVEQPVRRLHTSTRTTVVSWLAVSALVSVLAFTLP
ncbi:MAG: acyltransferase [Actinobacteria bacterium]|nr:acyltransferase [Actinomycetota bacterium]